MRKINTTKGFTLIELLVVIAIIGILSSIILASLNTARAKGSDAAIQSSLDELRSQAEIYADSNNNSYGPTATTCSGATSTVGFIGNGTQGASILAYATSSASAAATCDISSNAWAIQVPMKSNSATSWCVDNNGDSKLETTSLTGTLCN